MNVLDTRRASGWSTANLAAAGFVLLAHALLVIPHLDKGELDMDEAGTFFVSTQPLHDVLTVPTAFHSQPPLFYLVLGEVARLSDNEPVLRMVPWVFMLALGISVLLFVRELSPAGRVAAAAVLLCTDYSRYLALMVRPYSMAVFLAFWSCLLFWRLVSGPASPWKTLTGYAITTVLMVYTVSIAICLVVAEGLVATIVLAVRAKHDGVRPAFLSLLPIIVALLMVALTYLPFALYVWSLRRTIGHASTSHSLHRMVTPRFFVTGPLYLLHAAYGTGFLAAALVVYAAWQGLLRRVGFVAFLMAIVAGQIAFSHGLLAGRTGFAFRYLAPAFPALCLLVGVGAEYLYRNFRRAEQVLVTSAAALALGGAIGFAKTDWHHVGPWRQLRTDLDKMQGEKIVFFDVGWDGQRLQYETRRDRDITVLRRRGTGWSWGGSVMTPDYITRSVDERRASASAFFYQFDPVSNRSNFDSAFVPAMEKIGCKRTFVREVPTYTRTVADPSKGALVVGYSCNAG
jgi:hypothetical protein